MDRTDRIDIVYHFSSSNVYGIIGRKGLVTSVIRVRGKRETGEREKVTNILNFSNESRT